MFEDESQRASWRRHGAIARGVAKRGLVAFLAFAMAFGTTPAQMWADGAEGIAEAVAQAATGGEGAPANEGTGTDTDANSVAASVAADGAAADQGANASAANGDDTTMGNATESENSATTPAASEQKNAVAAASATTLSGDAKVFIQDTKDKDSSYSTKSGALKAGDTLWANMYDEVEIEDDWGDFTTETQSVANPGAWTYTWLAGTVGASKNVADYTEVVGHEQSLTVTDAMEGKYFICKVTADGKDYYGPAANSSGINAKNIPGPVLGVGQAQLDSVKLSNSSPAVGDEVTATAYVSYNTPVASDTNVTFTWYESTNKNSDWTKIDDATSAAFTVPENLAGKYLKVVANAGVNDVEAKTSDAVLKAGAVKLAGVELSASSKEVGATVTAKAYTGSSYSPSYVDNSKVTYTWKKYKGTSAPSSSTTWETIEGVTGSTLTVGEDLAGYYVSVSANAGANDVAFGDYSTGFGVGPFKLAGAVEIYSAILAKEGSTSGTYVYTADDTVQVLAKEKGASNYIDASKLNYQWQVADKKNGDYADIEGATSNTLKLASHEGKSVRCVVTAKVGDSTRTTKGTNLIGAATSVNVTSVKLDKMGEANAGEIITATANAASGDVTANEHVSWSWCFGDTATTCTTKIDGATTNTFTPDATYAGKYVVACANGGFGDQKSSAVLVVEAGSVELYGVEVTGALESGQIAAGKTLTAKATKGNSYTSVSASDKVHYQWQYSNDKSSLDSHFENIADAADSATYAPTNDMVGKYIRVIATSKNSVKSTQKKSYGSTQSVDPVGPVTLAGQYTLKSVGPKEASTAVLSVGTTLTPCVKIPGSSSWSDSDLPADAKLTVAWYAKGEGDADWTELTDGIDKTDGSLAITDALVGKRIKVTASALDNTVEWVSSDSVTAAGEYNLLRVIALPQINSDSTHLVSGDSVKATVQARRADGSTTNGIDVTDKTTVAWYAADDAKASASDWTLLSDMSGASATVSATAAGKYLKAVATSGSSTVELVSANPVIAAGSLEAAVQKLNDANKQIVVDYSAKGGNVNDALKEQLVDLGYADIDVKVSEGGVAFKGEDAKATAGISDAQDKTNGDVTYFYIDPNDYSGYNIDGLRSADVVFELSRNGESVRYKPNKTVQVAWDEARVQQMLDDAAEQIAIGYAVGDSAESVTSNLTLPYRTGSKSKLQVAWKSSNEDAIKVSDASWSDYTGKVTRASSDRAVTLTATVSFVSGGPKGVEGSHDYAVTVKSDPEKVNADKKALQSKIDATFTYDNIKYSGTDTVADKDGLTADLQMPRTSTLGVDGKYYKVEYSAGTDDITFNGYRGTVFRPLPGAEATKTKITLTVTDKSNSEVTASKTLDVTIAPQNQDELDTELSLMKQAKAGYAAAILNGQDAAAVTTNMHAFQKAYLDADGNLAWSYDKATTDATSLGVVPVDLPGYDAMSGQDWRLFKSSNGSVVASENLKVSQPEYNTKVTISSRLTSEKYARYAERYPDNEIYAKLANQDVSATLTVLGTTGIEDPNAGKTIIVTAGVTGLTGNAGDSERSPESIVSLTQVPVQYDDHKTAGDVLEQVLENAGCTDFETNSLGLTSLKTRDGRILGSDWNAPYRYWSFYINGAMADVGATQYVVQPGDTIEYRYFDGFAVLTHTVTFDAGEGSAVAAQKVEDGKAAARPDDPTREGYTFAGWCSDAECTQAYDFSTPVSGDVTLYAKWTKNESATVSIVGVKNPDAATPVQDAWLNGVAATYAADSDTTAWDLIRQALDAAGLKYDASTESWGVFVKSITSADGVELGTTADYSRSWGFYVNGESASEGVSSYKVKPGDALSLIYLYNFKEPATEVDGVIVDPSAKGPDWSSSWPAAGTGATEAPTPTGATEEKWVARLKESSDWSTYVSEPITAGDYLFIVAGNTLYQRDAKTGDVVKSAKLVSAISSVSRMAYADGLVLVPLGDGRVQALTADALTTVWVSEKLPDGKGGAQQCQGNLTVSAGKVYFQTSAGWSGPGGYSVCLDLVTGKTVWKQQAAGTKANYYWTGMGVSGDYGFVGNMDGTVETVDLATGESVSSLSLGASVRSGVTVAPGGKVVYVVSYDGYLHKLGVGTAGVLTELGKVSISNSGKDGKGAESFGPTSTPVLSGNRIYVGGVSADRAGKYGAYYGQLTVVDADSMSVVASVSKTATGYISGEVKSTPVVSQQGDATYVYFTGNNNPGALYRYKVGDTAAEEIYTPASANQNYGMCTPAVGADGTLYYINDSGNLFAVGGKEAPAVKTFTVRFDTGEGSAVADQTVDEGGRAAKPADPEREGYTFDGWYADADGTQPFDFDSAIASDVTVYAKWSKKEVPVTISVTGSVTGVDAENKTQVWADKTALELPEGATAADLSEALFEQAGLVYDATPDTQYGWRLNSITSPDGRVLGTVDMGNNRWAYWSLVVNGEYAQLGASSIVLKSGDDVSWVYEVPEAPVTHTVTFDAGEGSAVAAQKVEDGKAAARPDDPTREGYTFAGWCSDAECTQAYDFSTPVSGDVTLYAKWTKNAAKQITVSATLYGVDGDKMSQPWAGEASLAVDEGSTIQKVTERYFESLGIDYQLINLRPYGLGGVELYSVTSTVDGTALTNKSTSYWQAFVNGVRIDDSLDEAKLNSGDKLVWRYLVDGKRPAELVDGVVVEPDADRPVDSKSDATGFGNAVTNADTPTGATAEAWTFNYKQYVGGSYANASEPVIVDGYIYLAVNDQLLKIDCQTGKVASSAKLKASVSYTARPVYAKGLVMVPLSGGSVQALTVDKLKTVWMTSAVSAEAQSSSSLTVDGDYLYIGTADGTRDITKFVNGFVVCIDIQSGKEVWRHNNANEGYYWTGGVAVDGKFVVPTSSGTVEVLDQKTGEVLGELSLGVTTNSSIVVSQDGKTMYLVTRDGKLHVISFDDSLRSEASLSEKTVDLGLTGCASIPTLLDNNTLLVGGEKGDSSALAIVDLKTMSVKFVSGSDGAALPAGGIKAAPLVSKQAEGTYVYFTVNSAQSDNKGNRISGGGVYRYKMGDAEATLAYDASGHNEYCDSPVVSDRYGNLYYINDSGTLFRLSDGINVVLSYGDGSSSSSAVFKGNKLVKPADPTREGYTFAGWYTDEACTVAYDFDAAVTADITLYAKWTKNAVNPGGNGGSDANGGSGSGNGGSDSNGSGSNGNADGSGSGANSGSGTNGQQTGGAVSPGQKPVSSTTTTTETKDDKDSKKDSDKSDNKSDKKDDKSGKSDAGSSAATTVKKSAGASEQESGFNPLAIVGVAVGVIGLALIAVFVLTKRGKGDGNVR